MSVIDLEEKKYNDIAEFIRKHETEDMVLGLVDICGIGRIVGVLLDDSWNASKSMVDTKKALYHGQVADALGRVKLIILEHEAAE
jgi:hypothetical protein